MFIALAIHVHYPLNHLISFFLFFSLSMIPVLLRASYILYINIRYQNSKFFRYHSVPACSPYSCISTRSSCITIQYQNAPYVFQYSSFPSYFLSTVYLTTSCFASGINNFSSLSWFPSFLHVSCFLGPSCVLISSFLTRQLRRNKYRQVVNTQRIYFHADYLAIKTLLIQEIYK